MTISREREVRGARTIVAAPVDEVCLMEDRGRVTRKGVASLKAGRHCLVVEGVSPALVDKSLVVASSAATIIDARVIREVVADGDVSLRKTEVGKLKEELRRLETEAAQRSAKIARGMKQAVGLSRAIQLSLREMVEDASWAKASTAEDFAQIEELRNEALVLMDARAPLEQEQDDNRAACETLRERIAELRSPSNTRRALIEIDVEAKAACEATIRIDYAVPGACWRPAHRAELIEEDSGSRVRFETDACVWQNTGEDWHDVKLVLSTERASLGVEPPSLDSDVLRVQRKSQTVQIEAREQSVDSLTPGGSGAGAGTPKLPGIDDGGATLNLEAPGRSTLPSDGRPHRIFLSSVEASADVALIAMPELSPCALLSSTLENTGTAPLLAGPVDLIRQSGVVGRSKILYVASGERFELGWGPEAELRIRRDVSSGSESSRVLSSWRVKEHEIKLRVSNIGQRSHSLKITERIPVSEIDKVKIELDSSKTTGKKNADANGFVQWTLDIGPMAHETVELHYRVKKHENVEG